MTQPNLAAVLAMPIAGNAFHDHDLWMVLYAIAGDEFREPSERAAAIRHMDKVTGVPESAKFGDDDAALIADYMQTMEG